MTRICRFVIGLFVALYVAALGLFVIGTFGLLGQERDPLSGVFLLPLGWPWTGFVDLFPEPLWPWLTSATPLLNLAVLVTLCSLLTGRHGQTR
jgi:hypothetical protein